METIICPTDFSKCADNAVHYAHGLAPHWHARLILFHSLFALDTVTNGIPYGATGEMVYIPPTMDANYEKKQRERLEEVQQTLKKQYPGTAIQYENRLRYGLVKDTLPTLVKDEHADLVVMGTEGAHGFEETLFGSNAVDTLESVGCPLLIVPHHAKYKPIRRIVFATDLGGEPYAAVSLVLKLAKMYDAEILFLHLLSEGRAREGTQLEARREARTEMNNLYKALPYDNVSFYTQPAKDIEEGIRHFAQEQKADLLVMGHHPGNFWQRLFGKEQAKAMAFHTQLPLLILPYRK